MSDSKNTRAKINSIKRVVILALLALVATNLFCYNTGDYRTKWGGNFEDINLFTCIDTISKVYFIQVKGSMAIKWKTNLQNAIISTIINMYKSNNSHLNFKLLIFVNKILSNFYLLLTNKDKSKIVFLVLKELKIIKINKSPALVVLPLVNSISCILTFSGTLIVIF